MCVCLAVEVQQVGMFDTYCTLKQLISGSQAGRSLFYLYVQYTQSRWLRLIGIISNRGTHVLTALNRKILYGNSRIDHVTLAVAKRRSYWIELLSLTTRQPALHWFAKPRIASSRLASPRHALASNTIKQLSSACDGSTVHGYGSVLSQPLSVLDVFTKSP